jgi:hypothetical protein
MWDYRAPEAPHFDIVASSKGSKKDRFAENACTTPLAQPLRHR